MKKDWTYKKLGELTKIKTGKLDANASSEDGIYPFFTCSREPLRISSYSYDCECVLVAGNGELNVKYYRGKFDAYQRTYIIEALPDSGIMTYYMYHFFNQYVETLRQKSIGGIIKYIKLGDLTNALIPIPPLSIQRSIVSELDLLHSVIEKKQEQLRALDNLAQSLFYQMFGDPITNPMGWEIKKLGEVAPVKPYQKEIQSENGLFWLLNLDMVESQTGKIIEKNMVTKEEIGNSTTSFSPDNVLYSKLRPYLNKVVLPNNYGYCTTELLPLLPMSGILTREYLCYLLRSNTFVEYINIKVAGAKMPRVTMNDFRKFPLPLPPLSLQQSFAAKVSAIEAQKQAITQSIKDVESLLAQRMDHYFG